MIAKPTPLQNNIQFKIEKKIISDKNNEFLVLFQSQSNSEIFIEALQSNNLFQKVYSNIFPIEKIKKNKYFYQFDNLKEICEELTERIEKEVISLNEKNTCIILSIPLPSSKIKEIIFELNEYAKKNDKQIIDEITLLINKQKNDIANINKDIKELKKLKNEYSFLLNNYILNLDSLIIDNNNYNNSLKNWINPNKKIKANLLYRLSRDGPEISTFHQLCDNKGPSITLFHLKKGNKIGFFINDSFDSISNEWKTDNDSFIFNLEQNKRYKKKKGLLCISSTFFCGSMCGPNVNGLGCYDNYKLNIIFFSSILLGNVFENGSEILPPISIQKEYEVNELEIFQIIIYY